MNLQEIQIALTTISLQKSSFVADIRVTNKVACILPKRFDTNPSRNDVSNCVRTIISATLVTIGGWAALMIELNGSWSTLTKEALSYAKEYRYCYRIAYLKRQRLRD